ncbi:hypothetical protein ACLOJK_039334 [Asimina triloba]
MVAASGTRSWAKDMTAESLAKEMVIRRRMTNTFNKREDDFPSLREYNDYLEEVEDMTSNLVDGIDVAAIEAKIAQYEEENAEQIINARARKAEELAAALAASKGHRMQPDLNDVATGQGNQAAVSGQGQYAPAVAGGSAFGQLRPTGAVPLMQPVPVGGGQANLEEDEETQKLRIERGKRAGGWTMEMFKKRAFEEAFDALALPNTPNSQKLMDWSKTDLTFLSSLIA